MCVDYCHFCCCISGLNADLQSDCGEQRWKHPGQVPVSHSNGRLLQSEESAIDFPRFALFIVL